MIHGVVTEDGVPIVQLTIGRQSVPAVVDTGFNGDLELPAFLRQELPCRFIWRTRSFLAGGLSIEEDLYLVNLEFDGRHIEAEATFAPGEGALIGTRLLRDYHLGIDFVSRIVTLRPVKQAT